MIKYELNYNSECDCLKFEQVAEGRRLATCAFAVVVQARDGNSDRDSSRNNEARRSSSRSSRGQSVQIWTGIVWY